MSDTPPFDSFLKWKLGIESPSLAYAAKTVTRNIIVAVDVPYPLPRAWHEIMKKQKNNDNFTCNFTCDTAISRNVTDNNRQLTHCAAPT